MKFVHIADMHLDAPFRNLSDRETLGDLKRLEQRKVFKNIINYIKQNKVDYFFIAGDFYEQAYIKKSTIEYVNQLFQEIQETKIFIAPGNHDPNIKNSYYQQFNWNSNVTIFGPEIKKIEFSDIDIYGYGFDDFYCTDSGIEEFTIEDPNKANILVIHGTLDGANIEEKQYNSFSTKLLKEKGFDYIALGHIHKSNYLSGQAQNIIYPGSTVSLGFDELGEHGMIVGDLEKGYLDLKFIPLDESRFLEIEINVTNLKSKEELIEKIIELTIREKDFVKVVLTGERNFEIDSYELYKLVLNPRVIKIKNTTRIAYKLDEIANENTLRGLFAKEMYQRLQNDMLTQEDKDILEKAVEIGFEALE